MFDSFERFNIMDMPKEFYIQFMEGVLGKDNVKEVTARTVVVSEFENGEHAEWFGGGECFHGIHPTKHKIRLTKTVKCVNYRDKFSTVRSTIYFGFVPALGTLFYYINEHTMI